MSSPETTETDVVRPVLWAAATSVAAEASKVVVRVRVTMTLLILVTDPDFEDETEPGDDVELPILVMEIVDPLDDAVDEDVPVDETLVEVAKYELLVDVVLLGEAVEYEVLVDDVLLEDAEYELLVDDVLLGEVVEYELLVDDVLIDEDVLDDVGGVVDE